MGGDSPDLALYPPSLSSTAAPGGGQDHPVLQGLRIGCGTLGAAARKSPSRGSPQKGRPLARPAVGRCRSAAELLPVIAFLSATTLLSSAKWCPVTLVMIRQIRPIWE